MEKIRVDGELGDEDGDDDLGDGVAFLLNLVGTLDPTCVELNWVMLLRFLLICIGVPRFFTDGRFMCLLMVVKFDHAYAFFVTFLAFKTSFIRTFSVVDFKFNFNLTTCQKMSITLFIVKHK